MKIVIKADVKRYKPNELAKVFGMSLKTLNRNIKSIKDKIGEREGQWYSIHQVIIIFDHLDRPYKEYEIDDANCRLIERKNVEIKFYPQEFIHERKQAS
jgi:hypothetical protein